MKYFIDHKEKRIHLRQFVGDSCGFIDTPVSQREFSDEEDYVERLISSEAYFVCEQCKGF